MATVRGGIFVNYIPLEMSEEELTDLFGSFGRVLDLIIVRRPEFKTHTFGYVLLDRMEDTRRAIRQLNGYVLRGLKLKVEPTFGKTTHIFGVGESVRQQTPFPVPPRVRHTAANDGILGEAARKIRRSWDRYLSQISDPLDWPTIEQLCARLIDVPYEIPFWRFPRERRSNIHPDDVRNQPIYWNVLQSDDDDEDDDGRPDGTVRDLLLKRHPKYADELRDSECGPQSVLEGYVQRLVSSVFHVVWAEMTADHRLREDGKCLDDEDTVEVYVRRLLDSCIEAALQR